ncbi:ferredoxin reductase [Corynebacterium canis]|uniref:Ferredoxin reductase n=1 Tax=Corynebacterium canis TaxID=679663 RepID=A0A5C5ULS7_9CORY|nr:ferredoxin reductase [Corynebacterium canis]TWT26777.1 ferredoxin reductase [Corynebacterium canis]WJY74515.1 Stearoyl-CoA 9-desaturase electron transfer partner [Corynebacterium canis]
MAPALPRDGLRSLRSALRRFTTPLLPDDYTQLVNPLWSARELRGRIEHVDRPTADTVSLSIRPGWGVPVDFHAGQYIGIGVPIDGRFTWRSYSLTCAPQPAADLLTITVRAVERGKLSNHLVGTATPGMMVRLAAPAGEFHLTDPVPEKLLFVSAGTGITPIVGMLRTLAERDQLGDVVVVHSVRHRGDLLFAEVLQGLPIPVHIQVTSEDGRLGAADLERLVPDVAERVMYACGPSTMLDELEARWPEVRTERFTLDRASDATGGVISFGDRASVSADGATTILEAGEGAGVQLPFGCRMGICQTCVRPLEDGHAHDLRTGETHHPGERIRTCVCVAAGNLRIGL